MTTIRVNTQDELDAALATATAVETIVIASEPGVWLRVGGNAGASGSATVRAWDSATVEASGSATVEASGSATVRAWGGATVRAWDSATVRAWGSATVEASSHVAVHLHSARAAVSGGVVIDVASLDLADAATWLDYHGVDIEDGAAILHKAVNADLVSDHGASYPIGETVTAPDWHDGNECGRGLHLSPLPTQAGSYRAFGSRYLACRVKVADIRVLTDGGPPKCKVPTLDVLHEVDAHGRPLGVTS